MRFPIRLSRSCGLGLVRFAIMGTAGHRYVELADDGLAARLGWIARFHCSLDEIEEAAVMAGPSPYAPRWGSWGGGPAGFSGRGIKLFGGGVMALVFSQDDVVEVRLKRPARARIMLVPSSCHTLAVSPEDPEAFLEALAKAGVKITRAG